MTSVPKTTEIMQAMDVTEDDINENRSRRMSSRQRQRLENLQRRNLLIGLTLFIFLAFVATLCIFIGQQNQQIVFGFLGVGVTVINAIAIGFWGRGYMRLNADLKTDSPVEIYEGFLKRVLRPNGQVNNYVLKMYNLEFSVTKEVFKVFRHEKAYAFYATTYSDILLSAECFDAECQETPQD